MGYAAPRVTETHLFLARFARWRILHEVKRFWSQAPNFLLSEAQAVVASPQISVERAEKIPFITQAMAARSCSL
jgi:hypothetical protein